MQLLGIIVVVAWALTLITVIANVVAVPRIRRTPETQLDGPLVSVIIPARNEERAIETTVRAFLSQTYSTLELIVVNDRSADSTADILERLRGEDSRLQIVNGEEPPPGWLGKPWAVEQGSRAARGELLLLVDADLHYAPDAIAVAVEALGKSGASMVALLPRFEMRGFWENVAIPQLAVTAFFFVPLWLANRTTVPIIGIGGGTGMLIEREAFDTSGGYAALRGEVVDDVGLARQLRAAGYRTVAVLADDLVSLRMYHGLREVVDGFTKNAFATMDRRYSLLLVAELLMFVGHVLPYALALTGSSWAIAAVALITASRLVLFTTLRYRLDNALFAHPVMTLLWMWIFARSAWRTGFRRQLEWRGRTYGDAPNGFGRKR